MENDGVSTGPKMNAWKLDTEKKERDDEASMVGTGMLSNPSHPTTFEESSQKSVDGSKSKKKKRKWRNQTPQTNIPVGLSLPAATQNGSKPVIAWFRRDLRLHDNPMLVAANQTRAPVILVFLWSEIEEGPLAAGGALKVWLQETLKCLNSDVQRKYGNRIIFRKTTSCLDEIKKLLSETGANTVLMNDLYEPFLKERDDEICGSLKSRGLKVERFKSYLLNEPSSVDMSMVSKSGIGSVGQFVKLCRLSGTRPIGEPLDAPTMLSPPPQLPQSCSVEDLGLYKIPVRKDGTKVDWAANIRKEWNFSEDGAWEAMRLFQEVGFKNYKSESVRSDALNTGRFSPYIHFGLLSARAVQTEAEYMPPSKLRRKMAWRDMAYWLLSQFPDLPSKPVRTQYQEQPWSNNPEHLKAWQRGNTGYPLIDAGMRQLWQTGWCNNYMRHIVASFLISYLHISWVEGYKWFQDTLVDADVAINAMMWQNGGMSGWDQWDGVQHPINSALTVDPDGIFVRKWCPELARLPSEFIHQPWKCSPSIRQRAGVELGVNYPDRIITELTIARQESLRDVVQLRSRHMDLIDPHTRNDLVRLSNGIYMPVSTRREFKDNVRNPDILDRHSNAEVRGYRNRKRDEAIKFVNKVDHMSSIMNEEQQRYQRHQGSKHDQFY